MLSVHADVVRGWVGADLRCQKNISTEWHSKFIESFKSYDIRKRVGVLVQSWSWSDLAMTTFLLQTEAIQLVTATTQPKVDRPDYCELSAHSYPRHHLGIWHPLLSGKIAATLTAIDPSWEKRPHLRPFSRQPSSQSTRTKSVTDRRRSENTAQNA